MLNILLVPSVCGYFHPHCFTGLLVPHIIYILRSVVNLSAIPNNLKLFYETLHFHPLLVSCAPHIVYCSAYVDVSCFFAVCALTVCSICTLILTAGCLVHKSYLHILIVLLSPVECCILFGTSLKSMFYLFTFLFMSRFVDCICKYNTAVRPWGLSSD
jgi:hypothetical protein